MFYFDMASHEELIAEMDKLEKLSHTARLKLAKKRRMKQLKKFQEWVRVDRQTVGSITQKRGTPVISFENGSLLNDLVSRNDLIGGKVYFRYYGVLRLDVFCAWHGPIKKKRGGGGGGGDSHNANYKLKNAVKLVANGLCSSLEGECSTNWTLIGSRAVAINF